MSYVPGSEDVRAFFPGTEGRTYTDTANYGLPPQTTIDVLSLALKSWADGTASWPQDWDVAGERCRELFAGLIGTAADEVALMPAVSVAVGLVATSLESGAEILVPEDEFRSVLFPLLAAAARRDVTIRRVPFNRLADEIRPQTSLVATSHVRSNGGAVQDLAALTDAARAHSARVLLDATHSAGVLGVDMTATPVDFLVAAAYKHLLCPRGVAFLRIDRRRWDELAPFVSSWRSAADPYASFYGGDLSDLAAGAARFDVSLAWHPWLGAAESLAFLTRFDAETRASWAVGLADELAERIGVAPTGSSIVSFRVGDLDRARSALAAASVHASFPGGAIRLSFHVYNTLDDVEATAEVCAPLLATSR